MSPSRPCTSATWLTTRLPSDCRDSWTIEVDSAGHLRPAWPLAAGRTRPSRPSSRAARSRPGGVRVDRRHRPLVPGVHRLEHVQRLGAAALADDDPVRPHPQAVLDQVAVTSPLPSTFCGRVSSRTTCGCWSCSSAASSIVITRSSAGMCRRQAVQQRRLARARAAGDQHVAPGLDGGGQEVHDGGAERPVADQVLELERLAEPPDAHRRAVQGQRRDDRVHAAAVGQPGVDHRAVSSTRRRPARRSGR